MPKILAFGAFVLALADGMGLLAMAKNSYSLSWQFELAAVVACLTTALLVAWAVYEFLKNGNRPPL